MSDNFIENQIECPIAFVPPDAGVTKAIMPPLFSHPGALAEMMQPQHAPVQATQTITDNERHDLGQPAHAFFKQIMRPTIKHV